MERNVITKLNKKLKTAYFKEKLPKGSNVEDFRNFCTEISERFNNYFVNIAEELGIYKWRNIPPDCIDSTDWTKFFNNHPSIQTIKVLKYVNQTDHKKSSSGEISQDITKTAKNEMLVSITNCINRCLSINTLSDHLKVAAVPVFKKHDKKDKHNYQSISLLLLIQKFFERILYE